ncbi:MAG: hypothetical protein ACI4W6_02300 [Acutalibacteraceae bacterium]
MSIKTMQATINGQVYDLTLNESTGKYEAVITAPSGSSFNLENGYYPVSVTATDTAGNSTTVDSTHATLGDSLKLYVKEQNKPVITILEPSHGAYVTNSKPAIKFKIVDNTVQTSGYSGVNKDSLTIDINGYSLDSLPIFFDAVEWTETDGGYIGTLNLIDAAYSIGDGQCTIKIDCKDNDGNSADTASCTFTVDTLAPSLTVDMPADGLETNQSELTVSGSTDDVTSKPVSVNITLNGVDQGEISINDDGTFSKDLTLSQQGENTIVVTATDSAGKVTTVTRTVTFNTTAPVIKSVVISPNPVNAGNTYTITVEVE